MTVILGIDCGLEGGIAALLIREDGGCSVEAISVPTLGEKAKRRVDVGETVRFIKRVAPMHAFIERSQAMPKQGSSSGFIYGRAVGALEACVGVLLIPHTIIEASVWKRTLGLVKAGKEDSRLRALQLFPGTKAFERKKDHNRAEAALIAWYGWRHVGTKRAA